MPGVSETILVHTSPKAIYHVVLDFENYPKFLPDVKKAVVEKKGRQLIARFEISVIKKINYALSFTLTPDKKIAWTFVEGDVFKDNHGHWKFEEVKKGQTRVTYHIEVEFGFMVPSLITDRLVGSSLPKMMQRFKERAESLT